MRSVWRYLCGWQGAFQSQLKPQHVGNWENRFFSNSLPWLQIIIPGRPYLSMKSLYNRSAAVFAQSLRNGRITLTNTGSHHYMCLDGGNLNQLTLMVLLREMTGWVQQKLCAVSFF